MTGSFRGLVHWAMGRPMPEGGIAFPAITGYAQYVFRTRG
ncbi:hypothetical protein C8D89_11575 [Actinomycetospora cinnamomea]|uniref:Uncharacterized protein n=1 Tax=Actinomycetospora cinnamomea TaxID=663609 RepID=A0A2U1F039_9PSEU|nr:hypothetical protein C8D89_11575 [Actinomycetospora cinnamomea]